MARSEIFDRKNVLIAGGAGFIGSHLCDELVKTSRVICVDNFYSGSELNIDHLLSNPNFIFINHDLSKPLDLSEHQELERFKVEFQGIQEVYDLACPMSPKNFLDNRLMIIKANSDVVMNLLDIAVAYQAKFMHFSSSVIYGPRTSDRYYQKMSEKDMGIVDHLSERGSYDEGKRFAETVVATYRDIYKIDAKIVRAFRIYGPRMELNDDQMIPDFINNAIDGKDLVIFGDENFASSFCYIDDLIDGVLKFMKSDYFGPINIGSDVDFNFTDLAMLVIKLTESPANIVYEDARLFMKELALPDIRIAKDLLSWMPVVTLENGLKKTIFALKAQKQLRRFEH